MMMPAQRFEFSKSEFKKDSRRVAIKGFKNSTKTQIEELLEDFEIETIHTDKSGDSCKVVFSNEIEAASCISRIREIGLTRDWDLEGKYTTSDFMICVSHFPHEWDETQFRELIKDFGETEKCFLVRSPYLNYQSMGYGFLEFTSKSSAIKSRNELHGKVITYNNRSYGIHVHWMDRIPEDYSDLQSCTLYLQLPKYCDLGNEEQANNQMNFLGEFMSQCFDLVYFQCTRRKSNNFAIAEYDTTEQAAITLSTLRKIGCPIFKEPLHIMFTLPNFAGGVLFKSFGIFYDQFQMNRQKKGGLLSTPGKREREIAMARSNSPPTFSMDTISHGYSSAKMLNSNPTSRSGSLTEWGLQQPHQQSYCVRQMGPTNDAVSSFVAMQNFEQFQDQIKPGKSGSTQIRGNKESNRTEQNKRVNLVHLTTDANLCENLFKQSVMQRVVDTQNQRFLSTQNRNEPQYDIKKTMNQPAAPPITTWRGSQYESPMQQSYDGNNYDNETFDIAKIKHELEIKKRQFCDHRYKAMLNLGNEIRDSPATDYWSYESSMTPSTQSMETSTRQGHGHCSEGFSQSYSLPNDYRRSSLPSMDDPLKIFDLPIVNTTGNRPDNSAQKHYSPESSHLLGNSFLKTLIDHSSTNPSKNKMFRLWNMKTPSPDLCLDVNGDDKMIVLDDTHQSSVWSNNQNSALDEHKIPDFVSREFNREIPRKKSWSGFPSSHYSNMTNTQFNSNVW